VRSGMGRTSTLLLFTSLFLSMIFFWKGLPLGGLTINYHVLMAVPVLIVAASRAYRSGLSSRQVYFLFFAIFYSAAIALSTMLSQKSDITFLFRSLYTLILVFNMSIAFSGPKDEGLAALGTPAAISILAAVPLFFLQGLDAPSLIDAMANLRLEDADRLWREFFRSEQISNTDSDAGALVNLRNPLSSVIAVLSAIALTSPVWTLKVLSVGSGALILSSLVSISGALTFMFFFILFVFSVRSLRPVAFVATVVAVFFVPLAASPIGSDGLGEYAQRRIEGTTVERTSHIEIGWDRIVESNFLGYFPGYRIDTDLGEVFPHNMFIGIWLNVGLLGFLLFTTFYVVIGLGFLGGAARVIFYGRPYLETIGTLLVFAFLLRALVAGPVREFCDYSSMIALAAFFSEKNRRRVK
jgi:hypothetical protein